MSQLPASPLPRRRRRRLRACRPIRPSKYRPSAGRATLSMDCATMCWHYFSSFSLRLLPGRPHDAASRRKRTILSHSVHSRKEKRGARERRQKQKREKKKGKGAKKRGRRRGEAPKKKQEEARSAKKNIVGKKAREPRGARSSLGSARGYGRSPRTPRRRERRCGAKGAAWSREKGGCKLAGRRRKGYWGHPASQAALDVCVRRRRDT